MISTRVLFAVVASLAIVGASHAQRVQVQPRQAQPIRERLLGGPSLVSPEGIEKLRLTADQKEKFAKIDTEFKDQTKSAQETMRNAIKDAGRDREKFKEATDKLEAATKKSREDGLAKFESILTAEQKKVLVQVKDEQPRRPAIGVRPIQPIVGGQGQLIPPGVQARLQLTDEQKKQIEAIQKEAEAKALKVLTDEQRKQYEAFKKNTVRPLPVRPNQPNIRIQPRPAIPANPANPNVPRVKKD